MKFTLKAKFKPAGDQPQAIKKLVNGLKTGLQHQVLLGVTGSGKTFTLANVIANLQKPTLIISPNKTLAAQLAAEFQEFFPDNAVHYFVSYYDYYQPEAYLPQTDTYLEKETSLNEEIDRLRHAATQALLTRRDVIIVASVSCIYGLGSPEEYTTARIDLSFKNKLTRKEILQRLIALQYKRNDYDFKRGTFRVRGGTIDIFPVDTWQEVVRLYFTGEKLVKIEQFNPFTQSFKTKTNLTNFILFPATHYLAPQKRLRQACQQIRQDLKKQVSKFKKQGKHLEAQRLESRTLYDLEMIEATGYCNGIENYSRYFDGRSPGEPPYTLLDFFTFPRSSAKNASEMSCAVPPSRVSDYLLFIDESHQTIPQIRGMYMGDRSRKEVLVEYGFRLPAALDNRPLNFQEFEKRIGQTIYVSATPGEYELSKLRSAKSDFGQKLNKKSPWSTALNAKETSKRSKKHASTSSKKQNREQISKHSLTGLVEQIIRPTGLLDPKIEIKPTKHQIDDLIEQIQLRVRKKQRVLVTTLTKRMAEELSDYLQEIGIKAYYLHSEIDTLARLEILRDLRSGVYDVVVGINLLREGLDLPEVSLVAILDADKEGFLRSTTSLIQIMGRAARHVEGHIIMYADSKTSAMRQAISEVQRRRRIQEKYNQKHRITPQSIIKKLSSNRLAGVKVETKILPEATISQNLTRKEANEIIKILEKQMTLAAKNLEFEKAAILRDKIKSLKNSQQEQKIKKAIKKGERFARLKALKEQNL